MGRAGLLEDELCPDMKPSELKMLWRLVRSGEERKLSAADLALLLRIRFALQAYEAKCGQGGN